jgi:hypothetical protein
LSADKYGGLVISRCPFSVIPGLTRNPVIFCWIPAGVYPALDAGQEWRYKEIL